MSSSFTSQSQGSGDVILSESCLREQVVSKTPPPLFEKTSLFPPPHRFHSPATPPPLENTLFPSFLSINLFYSPSSSFHFHSARLCHPQLLPPTSLCLFLLSNILLSVACRKLVGQAPSKNSPHRKQIKKKKRSRKEKGGVGVNKLK